MMGKCQRLYYGIVLKARTMKLSRYTGMDLWRTMHRKFELWRRHYITANWTETRHVGISLHHYLISLISRDAEDLKF